MKNVISIIVNFLEDFLIIILIFMSVIGYIFEVVNAPKIDRFFYEIGIADGINFYGISCVIILISAAIIHAIKNKWLS